MRCLVRWYNVLKLLFGIVMFLLVFILKDGKDMKVFVYEKILLLFIMSLLYKIDIIVFVKLMILLIKEMSIFFVIMIDV